MTSGYITYFQGLEYQELWKSQWLDFRGSKIIPEVEFYGGWLASLCYG